MKFWNYIKRAFSVRPIGMFIPPNWIGLGIFAFLGLLNSGFWLLGLGLEITYLYLMATSRRFQTFVNGTDLLRIRKAMQVKISDIVGRLSLDSQRIFHNLERICRTILDNQRNSSPAGIRAQSEGLGKLLWIYLRLLQTRESILRVYPPMPDKNRDRRVLEEKLQRLEAQLKDASISEELRRSLSGQADIIRQRMDSQSDARKKIDVLTAELNRVEEQVELIREQAVLTTDPQAVSNSLDRVTETLNGTNQWIREQQQIYGTVEDMLVEPPTVHIAPTTPEKN